MFLSGQLGGCSVVYSRKFSVDLFEFPENKLCKIFPHLKDCTICSRTNRREETVISQLHIGHSYITQTFLLKGEEPLVCIACNKQLTEEITDLFTCSDFTEIRGRAILRCSHCMFYFRTLHWRSLTIWKKSIFLAEYKLSDSFGFCLYFTHSLSLFLKIWL